jgi:hypothetical protein
MIYRIGLLTAARAAVHIPRICTALALFAFGVGTVASAYRVAPNSAAAYALFWSGLALCFAGVVSIGLHSERSSAHVLSLALFGAALYLPIFLRGADRPHFNDELFHIQLLEFIADLGTTRVPRTLYPLPGDYPGLELVGLGLMQATGLPVTGSARLTALLLHMLVPVVAYFALTQLTLQARTAFLGALLFIANTSYYFIHSLFSYETLGIVLFLLLAGVSAQLVQMDSTQRRALAGLSTVVLGAIVVTHHFTGIMTLGLLASLAIVTHAMRHDSSTHFRNLTLFGGLAWSGWLVYGTRYSKDYLESTVQTRLTVLFQTFVGVFQPHEAEAQVRPLFKVSVLPLWERTFAFSYPVLVTLFCLLGFWAVYRALRSQAADNATSVLWVAFGAFGPCIWLPSTLGILTGSSDAVFRSWPFLFLGVALYTVIGLQTFAQRHRASVTVPGSLVTAAALLLLGSIIIGDNQTGRFRAPELNAAAGGTAITADLMRAAEWLEDAQGPLHIGAGDFASQVVFATIGRQVMPTWDTWTIFFEPDPTRSAALIAQLGYDFVVVDWRVTRLPPRNQYTYYSSTEPHIQPIPTRLLEKFERTPNLARIYDNGDIVIYERRPSGSALSPRAERSR